MLFGFSGQIEKKRMTPPGTKFVKELGYYVDKQEMTVISWREFIGFTKKNEGAEIAQQYLPDTNVIIKHYGKNVYSNSRESHHNSLPIIGVTPEQIEKYCEFRTKAVNMKFGGNVKFSILDMATKEYLKDFVHQKENASSTFLPVDKSTKSKGFYGLFDNAPEIILADNQYKIMYYRDSLIDYTAANLNFSFRCIAKCN